MSFHHLLKKYIERIYREKIIIFIIIFGLVLRLYAMSKVGDLTWDEYFSITFSQKPLIDSFRYWLMETNPPLHMMLLKAWFFVFPINNFIARIPSILFGTLSVGLIYLFLKENFTKKIALTGALLLALLDSQISSSILARGYAMLTSLSLISIYYFYQQFINKSENRFTKLVIFNTLALFTHLTSFFLIISQIIYLSIFDPKELKKYFQFHIPSFVFIGLWYIFSFVSKTSFSKIGSAWFLNIKASVSLFINTTAHINPTLNLSGAIFIILSILAGAYLVLRNDVPEIQNFRKKFSFLLISWLLLLLFMAFTRIINIKFYYISTVAFASLLAIVLGALKINKYLLLVFILIMIIPQLLISLNNFPHENWKIINSHLNKNITTNNILVLSSYIDLLYIKEIAPPEMKVIAYGQNNETEDEFNKKIIGENYLYYKRNDQEIKAWLEKNLTNTSYNNIYILQNPEVNGIDISKNMLDLNYHLKNVWPVKLGLNTRLYLYERNSTSTLK